MIGRGCRGRRPTSNCKRHFDGRRGSRSLRPSISLVFAIALARLRWETGKRLGNLLFERGVDTAGHASSIEHLHPDRVWYQASGWSYLRRALPRSEVDQHDVFVDFGCGKGRVVYQAAHYPLRRVIGVEIAPELSEWRDRTSSATGTSSLAKTSRSSRLMYHVRDPRRHDRRVFLLPVRRRDIPARDRQHHRLARSSAASSAPRVRPADDGGYILGTGRFQLRRSVRISDIGLPHRIGVYESVPPAGELQSMPRPASRKGGQQLETPTS